VYEWDAYNRLTSVCCTGQDDVAYTYDALGRLLLRREDPAGDALTMAHYWLGLLPIVAETWGEEFGRNPAAVAVDSQPSPGLPMEALMHPELVARWPSPMLGLQGAFWRDGAVDGNWGGYFGLGGVWSLLPLVMIWGAAWWWLGRMDVVERGGER
jgi:YD repeat-containing protein